MNDYLQYLFNSMGFSERLSAWITLITVLFAILIISIVANYIAKHYIVRIARGIVSRKSNGWAKQVLQYNIFNRLSHLVPALVIYLSIPLIFIEMLEFTPSLAKFIRTLTIAYVMIAIGLVVTALLNGVEAFYNTLEISKRRPIKSYLQVAKLILTIFIVILVISLLLDRSPIAFLTGLGALTAVIMLVFQDSIKGFVASLQINLYDMAHIGDWVEIPEFGADGDIIDMSLNTIKIQNWDKTIVTVPSYALLTNGVKNWRGMSESGGRRIKRSINIDMRSIKFASQELIERLGKIQLLKPYIDSRLNEIISYNAEHHIDENVLVNGRRMTNVGLFRAYINAYLQHHPKVHKELTFLIRQLQPTETGLPIEVYIFTNDIRWAQYENIQADIFDHLLAAMPEFDLRVFQDITGEIK